jgi:putative hemolysin
MKNNVWLGVGCLSLMLLSACSNNLSDPAAGKPNTPYSEKHEGSVDENTEENSRASLPDPSLRYCTESGFKAIAVLKDGIPQSYQCVNPEKGLKCDSWEFYRGQCSLGTAQPE